MHEALDVGDSVLRGVKDLLKQSQRCTATTVADETFGETTVGGTTVGPHPFPRLIGNHMWPTDRDLPPPEESGDPRTLQGMEHDMERLLLLQVRRLVVSEYCTLSVMLVLECTGESGKGDGCIEGEWRKGTTTSHSQGRPKCAAS